MKKHLLLGGALLAAISAYPQNGRNLKPSGITNMAERLASRFNVNEETSTSKSTNSNTTETPSEVTTNGKSSAAVTVIKLTGSMNVFGVLVSQSRPLQWNDNVNAVSFIHRGSPSYVAVGANATGKSGNIVAELSTNMGTTWDSTALWVNNTNLARYPQGGVYSAPGNTNYNNAYAVAMGPATGGSGWVGNFYASKSVSLTPKNQPGTDQQFFSNTGPFTPVGKHDFSRYSFSSTDDGAMRSIGSIYTDANGTTAAAQLFRGAQVIKGTFNAGAFTWTADSLIPPMVIQSNGARQGWSQPLMAWNEQGTVGYVMFIGARTSQTLSNQGWQPIVYKTTNSGASWALTNGIDFNNPSMNVVKNSIAAVNTNSNLEIPFFNVGEGYDIIVDGGNNLHIVTTVVGTARQHPDSLAFTFNFGTEATSFPFTTGAWPYIFDFYGNGTSAWKVATIDSMQTEGPGTTSTAGGFSVNPWAPDANGAKVGSDSRIQASRDPNGNRIAIVWAESDTLLTSSKYNQFPDLKARLICNGNGTVAISPVKTQITSSLPSSPINNRVKSKSYFNYISSKMSLNGSNIFDLPVTVTNNTAVDGAIAVDHFFIKAEIPNFACVTGLDETKASNNDVNYGLLPNPAKGNVNVSVKLVNANTIDVTVYNLVGQLVKSVKTEGQVGENTINVNLDGLNTGIYMVKVSANGKTTTKKLVVE
jgi:hypothetical protein